MATRQKLASCVSEILESSRRPLKAREILNIYQRKHHDSSVMRRDINSVLYTELWQRVFQDSEYRWRLLADGETLADAIHSQPGLGYDADAGRSAARRHIQEARELSLLVGGTDSDVKKYFFNLPPEELKKVLDEYGRIYGEQKKAYARQTIQLWKSGRRIMSGMIAERLFNLLPPLMPLSQKYELVRSLWDTFGPKSLTEYTIGQDCDAGTVTRIVEECLNSKVMEFNIPDAIEQRFRWLADGDVETYQHLLNTFREQEMRLAAADASQRYQVILGHLSQGSEWTETISHECRVGKHAVKLYFDPRAEGISSGAPKRKEAENSGCSLVLLGFLAIMLVAWFYT